MPQRREESIWMELCVADIFLLHVLHFATQVSSSQTFWSVFLLNGCFPRLDFVTPCFDYLRTLILWVMQTFQMWPISLHNIKKAHGLISTPNVIKTALRCWRAVRLTEAGTNFPKFFLSFWKTQLYPWQQMLWVVFFWSDRLTTFIFLRKRL